MSFEAIFDTTDTNDNKYKFGGNDTFNMGLGVYIIKGIEKNRPISFNIENNDYIEFLGLSQNIFQTDNIINENLSILNQKYNYVIDNSQYFFYSGTVALRVTGDFGTINGYYYLENGTEKTSGTYEGFNIENGAVVFKDKTFNFDSSKTDGSRIDDYLELYEIDRRLKYNFYYDGSKNNGLAIKCKDKSTNQNIIYHSYMKSYYDLEKSKCIYIESNGLPNYHSYLLNQEINNLVNQNLDDTKITQIDNHNYLWKTEQLNSYKVYNYGINRQSYGYRNESNFIVGTPFKIPVNIELAEVNTMPLNNINKNTERRFKESFWYKGSKNWNSIMIANKYDNINLGLSKPDNLLPLGPIGVAINGVPFHSHFEMTNDIQNINVPNVTNIDNPIIQREIILNNINYNRNDIVKERNYDNFGGTIDRNFSYFYNKYPVGLERMIKESKIDSSATLEEKIEVYLNDIEYLYLNISDTTLVDYEFSFITIIPSSGVPSSGDIMSNDYIKILNDLINVVGEVGLSSTNSDLPANCSYISLDLRDFNNKISNDSAITADKQVVNLEITNSDNIKKSISVEFIKGSDPNNFYINIKYDYIYLLIDQDNLKSNTISPLPYQLINNINSERVSSQILSTNGIYFFLKKQITEGGGHIESITSNIVSENSSNNGNQNVSTSGGSGSNCMVDYTATGGVISSITISRKGFGYKVGDVLSISGINSTITVTEISSPGHSPILGWAFDGFPIYGQIGYKNDNDKSLILLKSSYENNLYKQRFLDNNRLDPTYLDFCNGRFSATPEFPEGIYHYVCTLNVVDSNEDGINVDLNNTRLSEETIYAYPYIMGAYKGIPDIYNFDLVSQKNTNSTSKTGTDYNSSASDNLGLSSELIVEDNTKYEINLRSLKPRDEIFNSLFLNSINISQNQNFINFQQGEKPYMLNFSGKDDIVDSNFGSDINNFGNKLSILASSKFGVDQNLKYLKAYGIVYKFEYYGSLSLGNCVSFKSDTDTSKLLVLKSGASTPLLGVVVRIHPHHKICYVCVKGLCEVRVVKKADNSDLNINDNNTNETLIFNGTHIKIFSTLTNTKQYILGSYIKNNGSFNHLININTRIIYG